MYEELSELKSELEKTRKKNNYLRKEVDNAKSIAEEYRKAKPRNHTSSNCKLTLNSCTGYYVGSTQST